MSELTIFAREAAERIKGLLKNHQRVTVGIDGRCASGKTTLARELELLLGAAVVHADHFFLRPEQRSDERLSEPGGNLDRERLLAEVLLPRARGKEIAYRPFDCSTRTLGKEIIIPENSVLIVEGSYSLHPVLIKYYDLKIFLTVSETTQRKRLLSREGAAKAAVFSERWIPLEEAYFKATELSKICDMFFEIKDKSISFVQ